jgi:histidinol phosphatase-like PHP family hydrolase
MFSRNGFENIPAMDMHIHTVYSGHAAEDMTLANIVKQAEGAGLKQIAITEHVRNNQHLVSLDLLKEAFEKLEPAIKVYLGLEVDVDPRHSDGRLIEEIPEEFRPLIISTHAYPESSLMWYDDGRVSKRSKRRLLKK